MKVVVHQVPRHVVEFGHWKDDVVALESEKILDIGNFMEFHRSTGGQSRRRELEVECGKLRVDEFEATLRCRRLQSGVVSKDGDVEIVDPEESLIRRLVTPDSLHVINDVV